MVGNIRCKNRLGYVWAAFSVITFCAPFAVIKFSINENTFVVYFIAETLAPRTKPPWDCEFKVVALNCSVCGQKEDR